MNEFTALKLAPCLQVTPALLDLLAKRKAKATFFVSANEIRAHKSLVEVRRNAVDQAVA
jgi:peptidoglycan/xylan/chitin deacetylase (PgdA/CDA1 family)